MQTTHTTTRAAIRSARKAEHQQRRQEGRQRHEERKVVQKARCRPEHRAPRRSAGHGTSTYRSKNFICGEQIDDEKVHFADVEDVMVEAVLALSAQEAGWREEVTLADLVVLPAKKHGRWRRRNEVALLTDGETFEMVDFERRVLILEADDELSDGDEEWEVLSDESDETVTQRSLSYSAIVRGGGG
ncbi:hypothetical protein BV25DRAFT_1826962 [Artomyces pyxidatus]|uniref:Uncharacterized protein n=1 Tax=Artomyces pyxidatus TaxID=48021 RepID=A0ACB8SY15_9AGAM|nr:hypothetical protein BV25DRAFT_1826962 [Artomyces pyxidatus]